MVSAGLLARHDTRLRAWAVGGLGLFALLLAPLLVHELSTGFPNVQAAMALGVGGSANSNENVLRRLYELFSLGLVGGFLTANLEPLAAALSLLFACGLGAQLIARRPSISSLHLWGR